MGQVHKEFSPTAIARAHIGHLKSARLGRGPGHLLGNPYYPCPTPTQGSFSQATLRRSPQFISLQVGSRARYCCSTTSMPVLVGPAFPAPVPQWERQCNLALSSFTCVIGLFLLFLAQSGLKLAAIFLLPPIAGTTRHAPPHLALWSLGESYIPQHTCYSGRRTRMLAWKNLQPKVQWHKCAGSLVNHMATSLHISHRTLEAWLLHMRDKHF